MSRDHVGIERMSLATYEMVQLCMAMIICRRPPRQDRVSCVSGHESAAYRLSRARIVVVSVPVSGVVVPDAKPEGQASGAP
jgi:hypothetical protein